MRSGVASKALRLFTGTVAGQAITLLVAPLLTRLFTPDEFGVLGSFTAVLMILGSVIAMRYELAFTNVHSEEESRALLILCLFVTGVTSSLAAVALFAYSQLAHGRSASLPLHVAWAIPLGMLSIGSYNTLVAAATRAGQYGAIAQTKIWQAVASAATQVGLGTLGAGASGLLVGFVVGQSGGVVTLARSIGATRRAIAGADGALIRQMAFRHRAFALQSSWTGLLDAAAFGYLLTLVLGMLYGVELVGYVFLAERVVGRPLLMTANSLLQVYIGELAQRLKHARSEIPALFRSVVLKQFFISTAWIAVVLIAARHVTGPLFGDRWTASVPYIEAIAIATWPQSIMQAVAHTLAILGRTSLASAWSICRLGALCLAILVPYALGFGALAVIYTYAVVQLASHVVLLWLADRAIRSAGEPPSAPET